MLRRDFLKTAMATAAMTAALRIQASETPAMSKGNFSDVDGQHIFYSVHGAGKPLIVLHGGIDPDSFGSNLAALAKSRRVIAPHLQAHGRTPDTDRPLRSETLGDDIAALINHLKLGKADIMGYSLGASVALQTAIRHPDVVDRLVLVSAAMKQDGFYPEGWKPSGSSKPTPPRTVPASRPRRWDRPIPTSTGQIFSARSAT